LGFSLAFPGLGLSIWGRAGDWALDWGFFAFELLGPFGQIVLLGEVAVAAWEGVGFVVCVMWELLCKNHGAGANRSITPLKLEGKGRIASSLDHQLAVVCRSHGSGRG